MDEYNNDSNFNAEGNNAEEFQNAEDGNAIGNKVDVIGESDETGFKVIEGGNPDTVKKKPAKLNPGVYVHEFQNLFEYEGKKYKTLNFYFERLTGKDVIAIENEMQGNNEYALDPIISRSFQCKMASRASNIGSDVLESMPIQEFNKITNAARNFLISSGY